MSPNNLYPFFLNSKQKETMTKIIRFRYSALWNSEYPLVVNQIIDLVEAHELHKLHVEKTVAQLIAFRPQLAEFESAEVFDPDDGILSELYRQREILFKIIYAVTKLFQGSLIDEIGNHARCMTPLVKKHRENITSAFYVAKTKCFYDLIADVKAHPEIMKSLEALSLTPFFVQMEEMNTEFDRLFIQQSQHQEENKKINIRSIRLECDKAIAMLWKVIEFCCNEYGEQDYLPFITEINNLNAYYKQQLTERADKRKANRKISEEEPIEPWAPI